MKKIVLLFLVFAVTAISAKVIAKVNGYPIYEKDANSFLRIATKGKVKYNMLRKKDKYNLVRRLAIDTMVLKTAIKQTSKQERDSVIAGYWLKKKASNYKISDEEAKTAYEKNKKFFKDKDGKIVPYEKIKDIVKNSIAQRKVVDKMMRKARLVVGGKTIPALANAGKSSSKAKKSSTSDNKKTDAENKKGIYVVKSGNTLSGIANKYHISTKKLRQMNHMDKKSMIKIGQKLKVPVL